MEMAKPTSARYSVQEYFRLAEQSPTKLEYKAGQLIDMAGATYDHNRIAGNVLVSFKIRLKDGPCEAVGSDTRVQTADDRYCYPDVIVVCGEPVFDPLDPQRTITNPSILVEVLSPSTEIADRGEKFFRYIRMPSLREYFLTSQQKPRIESFTRRPDGSWSVGPVAEGSDAMLKIQSLNLDIPLKEIYANIRFASDVTE